MCSSNMAAFAGVAVLCLHETVCVNGLCVCICVRVHVCLTVCVSVCIATHSMLCECSVCVCVYAATMM